ncbi:unnamed protein product [Ambrosiozyma monospora]|uniref:Unnamed protein product n=1 Tax=Ambrosiozyma monospora TaxID=43982 RepID=A0ACB5UBB8_AMBMO|nr:unnamed protein product [Ambrosiozyma monospora]
MDSPTHNYHGQVPNFIGAGYNQEYTLSSTPVTAANNTRTNDNYIADSTNSTQPMIQHEAQYYSSETQVSATPSLVSYPQQSMSVPAYNYNYNYMIPVQAPVQSSADPSPSSSSIAYYAQQQQQQISLPPPLPPVTSSTSSMVPVNYSQFVSYPQSNIEYQQDLHHPQFIQQPYVKQEYANYMFRPSPMVDPNASKLPRATLEQKIEVLDWFHASTNKNQQATVDHFLKTD